MTGYFCSHNSGFITWLCRHLANRRCFPPPKGHRVAGTITTADDPLARENLTGHGAEFPTARPARRETDAPSLPLMPCHPVSCRQLSCRVVAGHTNLPWRLGERGWGVPHGFLLLSSPSPRRAPIYLGPGVGIHVDGALSILGTPNRYVEFAPGAPRFSPPVPSHECHIVGRPAMPAYSAAVGLFSLTHVPYWWLTYGCPHTPSKHMDVFLLFV